MNYENIYIHSLTIISNNVISIQIDENTFYVHLGKPSKGRHT